MSAPDTRDRRAYARSYYHAHRTEILARKRKWYRKNRKSYNAKQQETRKWYKARGICPVCLSRPAVPGRVLCEECAYRGNLYNIDRDKAHRNELARERYRKRRDAGRCVNCGKPSHGMALCDKCRAVANESARRRWRETCHRAEPRPGQCRFCDQPVVPGKRTCEVHLQERREQMAYARSCINREKHIWRTYDRANIEAARIRKGLTDGENHPTLPELH